MKDDALIRVYKARAGTPGGFIGVIWEHLGFYTLVVGDSREELLEAFMHGGRFTIPKEGLIRVIAGDIAKPYELLRVPRVTGAQA